MKIEGKERVPEVGKFDIHIVIIYYCLFHSYFQSKFCVKWRDKEVGGYLQSEAGKGSRLALPPPPPKLLQPTIITVLPTILWKYCDVTVVILTNSAYHHYCRNMNCVIHNTYHHPIIAAYPIIMATQPPSPGISTNIAVKFFAANSAIMFGCTLYCTSYLAPKKV